jgi:hypothetical protein
MAHSSWDTLYILAILNTYMQLVPGSVDTFHDFDAGKSIQTSISYKSALSVLS